MRLLMAMSGREGVSIAELLRRQIPQAKLHSVTTVELFLEAVANEVYDLAVIECGFGAEQDATVWRLLDGTSSILIVPALAADEVAQFESLPADDFLVRRDDPREMVTELASRIKFGYRRQEAYQALRQRYENVTHSLSEIIYQLDPDGRFVYLNRAIQLLGYTPDELLGRHFSEILDPETESRASRAKVLPSLKGRATGAESAPQLFDERRRGRRRTSNLEVRLRPHNGTHAAPLIGSVTATGEIVRTLDGTPEFVGTVGVIQDVTLTRRSREALRKLYAMAEESPASILVTDRSLSVEYANPRFYRTWGVAPDAVVGKPLDELPLASFNDAVFENIHRACSRGDTWRATLLVAAEDTPLTPQSVVARPVISEEDRFDGLVMLIDSVDRPHGGEPVTYEPAMLDLSEVVDEALRQTRSDYDGEFSIPTPLLPGSLPPIRSDLALFIRSVIRDLFGFALASGCGECSLAISQGKQDQIELVVTAQHDDSDQKVAHMVDRFKLSKLVERSDRMQRLVLSAGGEWELRRSNHAVEFLIGIPLDIRIDLEELAGHTHRGANTSSGYDVNDFLDAYVGNEDLLQQILAIYRNETPEKLLSLRSAVQANDFDSVVRISHSLANTSGTLQSPRAAELAIELESAARNEDSDDVCRLTADLIPAVETILGAISAIEA
jgi:PAS domain S-box-containing protein